MSMTESLEMLNAALMAQSNIRFKGYIKANTTDYPTFSDEQLSEMSILFRGFRGYLCAETPISEGHHDILLRFDTDQLNAFVQAIRDFVGSS